MASNEKYKIEIPPKDKWVRYADELQKKIAAGADEPELQAYLATNPWILLAVFGHDAEGFVFTEYLIADGEKSDFVIITGRSYPEVHLIELKTPKAELFIQSGRMSEKFNDGLMQSLNRMFILMNENDYHQNRFRISCDEVVRGEREHYQGRWAGPVTSNFTIPFPTAKPCSWQAKIVIGMDPKSERDDIFRSNFRDHFRIEVMHWDRLIRQLRKYV